MSCNAASEWTVVTRKSRRGREVREDPSRKILYQDSAGVTASSSCRRGRACQYVARSSTLLTEAAKSQISRACDQLQQCRWWNLVRSSLISRMQGLGFREDVSNTPKEDLPRFVCLGLGSFTSSANARNQLAIAQRMKQDISYLRDCVAVVSDPAMSADDDRIASNFGFQVVRTLDQALCHCHDDPLLDHDLANLEMSSTRTNSCCPLLLFMPHCEKDLYITVLQRLWGPRLQRSLMFCNSFSSFYEAGTRRDRQWTYMDAVVAEDVAVEEQCPDPSMSISYEAFNDLAVISFNSINSAAQQLWRWRPEN